MSQLFFNALHSHDFVKAGTIFLQDACIIFPEPNQLIILLNKLLENKDYSLGVQVARKAIGYYRTNLDILHLTAVFFQKMEQHNLALKVWNICKNISPQHIPSLMGLGKSHYALDNYDIAEKFYRTVLEIEPLHYEASVLLSGIYVMIYRDYTGGMSFINKRMEKTPKSAQCYYNKGKLFLEIPDFKQAEMNLTKALQISPNHYLAQFALATSRLTQQLSKNGFELYESRKKAFAQQFPSFSIPKWTGQNLKGKIILVRAEQGFGDTFQFVRFFKYLSKNGATVIAMIQKALLPLFSISPLAQQWISKTDTYDGNANFYCDLLSLPLYTKHYSHGTIDGRSYMQPNSAITQKWKHQISGNKKKIGIAWHGSPSNQRERFRKIDLYQLLESIPEAAEIYSLLKLNDGEELPQRVHPLPHDADGTNGAFVDTASIMSEMDIIVTVDTSIAHLAGALGIKTAVLLSAFPDWRWGMTGDTTVWYDTMKLFRQKEMAKWQVPLNLLLNWLEEQ